MNYHRILVYLAIFMTSLTIIDYIETRIALSKPQFREANPIMASLLGTPFFEIVKFIAPLPLFLILFLIRHRKYTKDEWRIFISCTSAFALLLTCCVIQNLKLLIQYA